MYNCDINGYIASYEFMMACPALKSLFSYVRKSLESESFIKAHIF